MPREVLLTTPVPLAAEAREAPRVWLLLSPTAEGCARWGDAPQRLLLQLRRVQPRALLFTLDLPGSGTRRREGSPAHVQAMPALLRERLAQAGLDGEPIGLIGHSLGALVATEWARQQPQQVAALVLLNPAMRPFTPILRATRVALWPRALGGLLRNGTHGATWSTALSQGLARWRYAASKRRPIARVLLLNGQDDPWRDWRIGQSISRAWGAALRLHPQAGHDLLLDDPDWVARAVAEWLLPVGSPPLP